MRTSIDDNELTRSNHSEGDTKKGLTVYFDGSCPLCSAEVNYYSSGAGGKKLNLVDVSYAEAELGADLTQEDAMLRFHVRHENGRLVSGARAFVELWRVLPGWKWLACLAQWPGVLVCMESAYRCFLLVRPVISRGAARLGIKAVNPRQ